MQTVLGMPRTVHIVIHLKQGLRDPHLCTKPLKYTISLCASLRHCASALKKEPTQLPNLGLVEVEEGNQKPETRNQKYNSSTSTLDFNSSPPSTTPTTITYNYNSPLQLQLRLILQIAQLYNQIVSLFSV